MRPDLGLSGAAVVTGAQGNLGPVWAAALAEAGADVAALDLSQDGAADLERAVGSAGRRFHFEVADVTSREDLERARDAIVSKLGVPTVLVNNAGIDQPPAAEGGGHRIEDLPADDFRRILDVNVVGAFQATQVFGSLMAAEGRGSIVNIGSLYASIAPDPSFYDHIEVDPPFLKPPAYGASKAALVNLTRYFARLWGPRGVRVNALSPGGVRASQDEAFVEKYCSRVPLGRMAEPEDLAGPLLFLASDGSRYLTGHELRVDGGFTA
jgi:NAD(P)-dependent dehydrogenase (short-subunit alcohol dehydrogenase family)